MSSESVEHFESFQREFNAYVDHITKEGKQTVKSKPKAKQEQVALVADAAVAPEPAAPKNRGRKPKVEEPVVVAPVAC